MLKSELEGLRDNINREGLKFGGKITEKTAKEFTDMLKASMEDVIERIDNFINFVADNFEGKSARYKEFRGKLSYSTHENHIKTLENDSKKIRRYLETSILMYWIRKFLKDKRLKRQEEDLTESFNTIDRKKLKETKKESDFLLNFSKEMLSSFKSAEELVPIQDFDMAGITYKGLLGEIVEAIAGLTNIKGAENIIKTKIKPSDIFRGYLFLEKLFGKDIRLFKATPEIIGKENIFHIQRENPAKNLWSMHGIRRDVAIGGRNITAACSVIRENPNILLGSVAPNPGAGIYIPNWSPTGRGINPQIHLEDIRDDRQRFWDPQNLWKLDILTLYYFLKAEDFWILNWLLQAGKSETWRWHERHSILIERGEDRVRAVEEEVERISQNVEQSQEGALY
jgi:hypothetical protein